MKDYRDLLYERYAQANPIMPSEVSRAELERQGRQLKYYLRGWLPERKDSDIFELGSAYGRLLNLLRNEGYTNVVGTDLSEDQVRLAGQMGLPVELGDGLARLESGANAIDLIVAIDVIEHLTKDEVLRFFQAAVRALRPGGRIILQTPNCASPWGMALRYGDFTHETGFTPDVLAGLLTLFGFSNIEFREVGPIPFGNSAASTVRALLWLPIKAGLRFIELVETGARGPAVLTRSMLVAATRA
ncbi:MAG TPA: class I SAM-dependent methyltransferase [Usitatibacter sp.]|nr:class I SAM-dependent methyltransferase [Usitatibacter sp.]